MDSEEYTSWSEIFQLARTSSFFLESRKILTVIIREEKHLSLNATEKNEIQAYLEKPNPEAFLIVYLSLDKTRDEFKQIRKSRIETFLKTFSGDKVLWVDLDRNHTQAVRSFIKEYFSERGVTITANAVERILELKGEDFAAIYSQLPKLEIGGGAEKHIDSEDVDEMVSGLNSHSIWDLTEAVEKEDAATYLEILRYLFINGIKPTFIIGTLISYYHKIYTAKFLLKHNFPVPDIGKVLSQPSFLLNKFIQMVRNFSEYKINEILRLIYRLDLESKTGGEESARILLQKFVFQVKGIRYRN